MYIVIAGGGLVGRRLAAHLVANRHDVVVIDRDREVCEMIATKTGALARLGSATDVDLLEEAGLDQAEVAVAVMRNDADNLAFATLARSFQVREILVRMRDPRYEAAYQTAGATGILSMVDLFVNQLIWDIEHPALQQVASLGGGRASVIIVVIPDRAVVDGTTVADIAGHKEFPNECVIAGIYREEGQEFITPRGQATIRSGDRVFLVAGDEPLRAGAAFLQKVGKTA